MAVLSLRAALPAATSIQDHIDPRFGIHERGNPTIAGKRHTVASWRALAGQLPHINCGLDARRKAALIAAMRHLDAALDRPVRVVHVSGWREVEVLGAVSYLANLTDRVLRGMFTGTDGIKRAARGEVGLFPALHGAWWIAQALDSIGIDWRDRPRAAPLDSGSPPVASPNSPAALSSPPAAGMEQRFVARLLRLLRADARFRALRMRIAEQVVGPDVLAMAVRARVPSPDGLVRLRDAELVWRHWDHYLEVARQAPGLLPLLTLYLSERPALCRPDAVLGRIKANVLVGGRADRRLGSRAWKYLLQHGARAFAEPLRQAGRDGAGLHVVTRTLRSLAEAGLPAPPSAALWREWIAVNGDPSADLDICAMWCGLPVRVRRIVLHEDARRRRQPQYAQWVRQAAEVMWWAGNPQMSPLALPADADWALLQRLCARRRAEAVARMQAAGFQWASLLGPCTIDGVQVVPLATGADLFDEGCAMHSCVADLIPHAVAGDRRYFSLRGASGRRLATVEIARRAEWQLRLAARRFNLPATAHDLAIGRQLAARYDAAAREVEAATREVEASVAAEGSSGLSASSVSSALDVPLVPVASDVSPVPPVSNGSFQEAA